MKTRVLQTSAAVESLADDFVQFARANPKGNAVIGVLENGMELFNAIAQKSIAMNISFSGIRLFELCSFEDRTHSVFDRIIALLSEKADFSPANAVSLTPDNVGCFGSLITQYGGIDYLLLELGDNAQIGFNEPGVQYSSVTHTQKLSQKTVEALSAVFGSNAAIPDTAYTMGISEIVSARHITVAALGSRKADALFKMLYARTDSTVPAAFLQLPYDVTVIADESAAEKL